MTFKRLSRRKFLRGVLGGLALVASSCAPIKRAARPKAVPPKKKEKVRGMSKVSLTRKSTINEAIEVAIELAGGMEIPKNATILIKPNQNSNDPFPATSNPDTVASLVRYIKRFSPKRVIVADASNQYYLPTVSSMEATGLLQAARAEGAEVIGLEDGEFIPVRPEQASSWEEPFYVSKLFVDADYVISQPVVKTHSLAIYTMALKNTIGVINYDSRPLMHAAPGPTFWRMIAELNLVRQPDFILLDGWKAMVTGGPFSGGVKEPHIIIGTRDVLAADAVGLALLKHLGTENRIHTQSVWEQPVLKHGVELNLGAKSRDEIDIVSEGVEEIEEIKKNLV
jgi:uncharacterized protein (DUF362 family)